MIKELLQQQKELSLRRQLEHENMLKNHHHLHNQQQKCRQFSLLMDQPELSLGPSINLAEIASSSLSESEINTSRKRKYSWEQFIKSADPVITQTGSLELQVKDPLPLDWEQCLDLESGRMYYLNRNTLKKSWNWPNNNKEQKLDLELNISPLSSSSDGMVSSSETIMSNNSSKKQNSSSPSTNSMVAVACVKCHLLVMLCKSSPSCPNCKYMHSLPSNSQQRQSPPRKTLKSLDTLSLLN